MPAIDRILDASDGLKRAIDAAFAAVGLTPDYSAANRHPLPAWTFDEQMTRAVTGSIVVGMVRRTVELSTPDRMMIHRLADHALAESEAEDRHAEPASCSRATPLSLAAYVAAGGAAVVGSFDSFLDRCPIGAASLGLDDVESPHVLPLHAGRSVA